MLATAIIVFREVLEASLVVGIVLAASRGVPRRGVWVTGGIAAGVLGAALVAAGAGAIAAAVNGIGQELFNAAILFTAVTMLGWHNIWMNRHGRELAATAATLGKAVVGGSRPLYALALVVGIAVLREGSEIVFFLYGVAIASGAGGLSMLGGWDSRARRRRGGRRTDLFRAPRHTVTSAVYGDELAHSAARRRHGLARRGLSDAGEPFAVARQRPLGHLLDPQREQHGRAATACADRLFGTAGRHPGRVLPRHASQHRYLDASDGARPPGAPSRPAATASV